MAGACLRDRDRRMLLLAIAALVRLRPTPRQSPFKAPVNLSLIGRVRPLDWLAPGVIVAVSAVAMLVTGDVPSLVSAALIVVVSLWFAAWQATSADAVSREDRFDLLLAAELSLDQIDARPGNVLVPVRNPHALAHVVAALQTAGDRDVVVMTVRLLGVDVSEDTASRNTPTPYERRLLSEVVALAERVGRPVRLLIVPARNVVRRHRRDGRAAALVRRVRRRIGDAVGRRPGAAARRGLGAGRQARALDVRLVIHHRSGRTDTYHLGAHPPSLTSGDLDLIHRLWLDAVKAVGPHVHHHDVVRAALTQMEQQLTGPERDEALATIRQVARPADELAAVLSHRATTRACAT